MSLVVQSWVDPEIARHHSARALAALSQGWGLGVIDARRNGDVLGSCEVTQPQGRTGLQLVMEELVIRFAARVGSVVGVEDELRINELAESVALSDAEAQALCDWAYERAVALVERAERSGVLDRLCDLLDERGGVVDVPREPVRDFRATIEVTPNITVNVAPAEAPVIHLTLPEQPAPSVTIENSIEQPDRTVVFHRDFSGAITEATIETEAEPETTT